VRTCWLTWCCSGRSSFLASLGRMLAAEHHDVRRICGGETREPDVAGAVSCCMKRIGALILTAVFSQTANGADTPAVKPVAETHAAGGRQATAGGSDYGVNLVAFVGRRIEVRYVERKPKPGEWQFDAEYFLRYEVLEVVFGTYTKKEIEFSSYIHTGTTAFKKYEHGLIYVSKDGGRFVQQKYLFQPVYPTAEGRWAGCGDPYAGGMPGSGVKPESITFKPPVVLQVGNIQDFQIEREFPAPMFRRKGQTVVCEMGNYPEALFRVMKEGYLTARGVFPSPRR
jgi:hypothetical protein